MSHSTFSLTVSDQTELFAQRWVPAETAANLVLIHGLAEHGARYAHVAEMLNRKGIAVHSFDGRGHGRSGKGAYFDSLERYLADIDEFVTKISGESGDKPLFVYGHSMGGGMVTRWAIETHPTIAGLIVSAGALKRGDDVPAWLEMIAPILGAIAPRLGALPVNSEAISRDPAEVAKYESDPLVYRDPAPARTGAQLVKMVKWITANQSKMRTPIYVMHGTGDRITNVDGSRDLYAAAASADKTLKIYDGLYHEMHNELEADRQQVLGDMIDWIVARM